MARRRKTVNPAPSRQPPSLRDDGETARTAFQYPATLIAVGFLILLAAYLVWFFRVEYLPDRPRYEPLGFLLVPDELVAGWLGGADAHVAVFDRVKPLAVAGGIGLAGFLLGWLGLPPLLSGEQLGRGEFVALATALGLSLLSLMTLLVGLFGGLRQPLVFLALAMVLVAVCCWQALRRGVFSGGRDASRSDPGNAASSMLTDGSSPWWWPRWWWGAIPFALMIVLGAVLPPLDFDVLEYHLQVPKEWYQQGRVTFLPHNVYGNMPLGAEMLAALAMAVTPGDLAWWWGALAGKVVMASFTLLTAVLLYGVGKRYFSCVAGVVAALIYLSTPWTVSVSIHGLNEGVIAFYLLAGAYSARLWWDRSRETGTPCWGLLVLTGWWGGAAVACKYTSLVLVACPLLFAVVVGVVLGGGRKSWQTPLVFAFALAAACGLWFAKSWALTGNPTYPLLAERFGGETRTIAKDAQWTRAHQVPQDSHGRRYTFLQLRQAVVNLLGKSLWHSPLIVPLSALILLRRGSYRPLLFWGLLLLAVLAAWWLVTHRLERFWVPAIPLMAILAGAGATWSSELVWRRTIWTVLVCGLLANFALVASPILGDNRYFVSLDQLRNDPRLNLIPSSHQAIAHRYLSVAVPAGSRALLVGDAAVFNLPVEVLYNTCFDDCLFDQIFRGRDAEARRAKLLELKITHIYMDWAEIERYRQPGNYGFSDYVTRELVHEELCRQQHLLERLEVAGLDPMLGEVFAVRRGVD